MHYASSSMGKDPRERTRSGPFETDTPPAQWTDSAGGKWRMVLRLRIDDQGWRCVGLQIEPAPGSDARPSMTSSVLREIPIGSLRREGGQAVLRSLRSTNDRSMAAIADELAHGLQVVPRSSTDRSRVVAEVYRNALTNLESPTKAVQEHFGLKSRKQAANWVARSRGRPGGLERAAGQGRAGEDAREEKA